MIALSFSIYQKEHVKIQILDDVDHIHRFFNYEFKKKFVDDFLLLDLSDFLNKTSVINAYLDIENIDVEVTTQLVYLINELPSYEFAKNSSDIDKTILLQKLADEGFTRIPTNDQLRNLQKLCSKNAVASFSVPGAGKTTEALGFYAFHRKSKSAKLLVISPINAFPSWDEQIAECFNNTLSIARLRGTPSHIHSIIESDPQFLIINYDGLRSPEKFLSIKNLILDNPDMTIVLDESHKMKGPSISEILMGLAPFINKKMILTGTPMPQASSDLRSQFSFLYPQEYVPYDDQLVSTFDPLYVRTTKEDLGLMPVIYKEIPVQPYPYFEEFYRTYITKKIEDGMSLEDILQIKSFKRAVLRLIKLLSNPISCDEQIYQLDPSLSTLISEEGYGAKIDAVIDRTNQLISKGEKVLIWTSFVINVEILAKSFGDKAVFIHGGVSSSKSESEEFDDMDTRESRIKRFKEDSDCMVLVANPAAAAESISLHEQCNYALYLDRTYNAGQFLQSQDRIHRLIDKDREQQKYIEVYYLALPGCVDEKVHDALNRKIDNMANFLNDPSLVSLQGFNFDSDAFEDDNPMDRIDSEEFYPIHNG